MEIIKVWANIEIHTILCSTQYEYKTRTKTYLKNRNFNHIKDRYIYILKLINYGSFPHTASGPQPKFFDKRMYYYAFLDQVRLSKN